VLVGRPFQIKDILELRVPREDSVPEIVPHMILCGFPRQAGFDCNLLQFVSAVLLLHWENPLVHQRAQERADDEKSVVPRGRDELVGLLFPLVRVLHH